MSDPMPDMIPVLPEGCYSDLDFDRLLGDELPSDRVAAIHAHQACCARCGMRHAELLRSRSEADIPSFEVLERAAKAPIRRPWRRVAQWSPILSAAALLTLWFGGALSRSPVGKEFASETRTKGQSRLGFYVKRGDHVSLGGPEEVLFPGDSIQFTYSAQMPGFLAVLSLDGARHATVYYPRGERAVPIAIGQHTLPCSTRLDEVLGRERLYALFCQKPVEVEPIRAVLESEPDKVPTIDGCSTEPLEIVKRQP